MSPGPGPNVILYQRARPFARVESWGPSTGAYHYALWVGAGFAYGILHALAAFYGEESPSRNGQIVVGLGIMSVCIVLMIFVVAYAKSTQAAAQRPLHDLLRTTLRFVLDTPYRGLHITAFSRPDELRPGDSSCLLFFAQNITNRPRQFTLSILADNPLGIGGLDANLHLSAGEAACLRVPFHLPAAAPAGEFEFILTITTIHSPEGTGISLLKIPTLDFLGQSSRLRVPLTVRPGRVDAREFIPLAPMEWLSLWAFGKIEPRYELLASITANPPHQIAYIAPPGGETIPPHATARGPFAH